MKIADASSARIWRIERLHTANANKSSREMGHFRGVSERIASMYRTVTPADTNFYAEGRKQVAAYSKSFVDIREFTYNYSVGIRSARMTDAEIEALIERMNLSHR